VVPSLLQAKEMQAGLGALALIWNSGEDFVNSAIKTFPSKSHTLMADWVAAHNQ